MKTKILIIIGMALILVIGLVLVYQITRIQDELATLNELTELKTELESPNVAILTYSWQDTAYQSYSLFTINYTVFNTGLKTALGTYVVMIFHYTLLNMTERKLLPAGNIQGRQSDTLINVELAHNFTVETITLETAWQGHNPST